MRARDLMLPDRRPEGVMDLVDKNGQRLQLVHLGEMARPAGRSSSSPPLSVFREAQTGLLRVIHRELVLRFASRVPGARRRAILADARCDLRRVNPLLPDQIVVSPPANRSTGPELIALANRWMEMEEMVFAAPSFLSEYRGADELACDEGVANAIRYAALHADVLSCSWIGGNGPDVRQALEDAGSLGRGGLGAAVFCSAGDGHGAPVAFPASDLSTVAVGACTDLGTWAESANRGPEISVVAPSSGEGLGGTSAAAAIAAGVAALVLSVHPGLDRWELKDLLEETAEKIGRGYSALGHSLEMGYGRVDAGRAVEEAARRVSSSPAYSGKAYSTRPPSCIHPPRSS